MSIVLYYGLLLVSLIIVLIAQANINSTYRKFSQKVNHQGLSGQEVARKILDANGLQNIYVVETQGELTDHYDPKRKVIKLSKGIFGKETIASIAVAAHECGHAIQDKEGYTFMKIRSFLVPIVNLISYLGYFGLIISIIGGITGYIKISIVILCASLIFQLVTLPVEFDASKRAKEQLILLGLVDNEESMEVGKVLYAAAMTYVASLASNLLDLLRLVLLLSGRRDD